MINDEKKPIKMKVFNRWSFDEVQVQIMLLFSIFEWKLSVMIYQVQIAHVLALESILVSTLFLVHLTIPLQLLQPFALIQFAIAYGVRIVLPYSTFFFQISTANFKFGRRKIEKP